ncbi:hypothetical protein L2E82_49799 [Cichorium intybus]|uniref:Uncharacterized protein n=1 Tax=Cichorium intybus TaxID=13427 RepID=A0ACB8Z2D1_CICIN|nr:hypothetical protein L2E82_49799 [Cichorium intybus]
MSVSQYRGIAPPPEKGKRVIEDSHEDSEDSPLSESSDDPDKIDAKTIRMKKSDTGPWQCSGEKSGDSNEPEELPKVRSLRLKINKNDSLTLLASKPQINNARLNVYLLHEKSASTFRAYTHLLTTIFETLQSN